MVKARISNSTGSHPIFANLFRPNDASLDAGSFPAASISIFLGR